MKSLKLGVYLSIDHRCNLNCPFCYQKQNGLRDGEKPEDSNLVRSLEWCATRGMDRITIEGGEPFYDEHIVRIVFDFAKAMGMKVHVITNGTLIPSWITEYKNQILSIQISLDNYGKYHEMIRGKEGIWQQIIDNIHWLKKENIGCVVHGVVTPETVRTWAATLDMFIKSLPADTPVGFEPVHAKYSVWKHLYLVLKMRRVIYRMRKKYPSMHLSRRPKNNVEVCRAGVTFVGLDTVTGKVYACHDHMGRPEKEIGSIESGISEEKFNRNLKLQDKRRYLVQGFTWSRTLSHLILAAARPFICPSENELLCGRDDIVPLRTVLYCLGGK